MFYLKYVWPLCHDSQNATNTCITDMLYEVVYVYILKHSSHVTLQRKDKHTKCVEKMKRSWDSGLTMYLGQYFLSSVGPNKSKPAETFRG